MNLDSNNLVVTAKGESGDSLAETTRALFLYKFNFVYMSNYVMALSFPAQLKPDSIKCLETSYGIYVRNPSPAHGALWEADPRQTSRDQLFPLIAYCAVFRDYKRLFRLWVRVAGRFMFAQNYMKNDSYKLPDQMWTCLGAFIRAGAPYTYVLYPLLFLTDSVDLLGNLLWLAFPYTWNSETLVWYRPSTWMSCRSNTDVDDNNTVINMILAMWSMPTPISYISRLIWGQFRPKNAGNSMGVDNNTLAALYYYHAAINDGNPDVADLYQKPVEKYIKRSVG